MPAFIKVSIWILISTLALAIIVVLFFKPADVIDNIRDERVMLINELGPEAETRIVENTNDTFIKFSDSIRYSVNYLYEKGDVSIYGHSHLEKPVRSLRDFFYDTLTTFWNLMYQSVMRCFIWAEIVGSIFLITIPSFIDGYIIRKIRTYSFGYTSPLFYQLGYIGIAACISTLLLLVTLPVLVPLWSYIVWVLLFSYCIRSVSANLQKKL